MPIRDGRLFRVPRSGLGWGFLFLSVFIVAAAIFSVQQQTSDAIVRHALRIEIAVADVFSALQDAENSQRQFLLSADPALLPPFHAASAKADEYMADLTGLVGGIEELAAPVAALRAALAAKEDEMTRELKARSAASAAGVLPQLVSYNGSELTNRIRAVVASIDEHQDTVVERRQARVRRVGLLTAASTAAAVLLLGCVALAAMREVRRKGELSRFLPGEIAHRLAAGDSSLREGRELAAAIAFVDIRGSTELAERLPVARLSDILSGFRARVIAAAEANGGLVDKFIGDGALVIFGVHDDEGEAAARSLAFARNLRARHAASLGEGADYRYDIGIGIHYGPTFCGIVGTPKRQEFTVLGDTVNVAARLEKETKAHGVDLLVSDALLVCAGEPTAKWRELTCDAFRSRKKPIGFFTDQPAGAALAR